MCWLWYLSKDWEILLENFTLFQELPCPTLQSWGCFCQDVIPDHNMLSSGYIAFPTSAVRIVNRVLDSEVLGSNNSQVDLVRLQSVPSSKLASYIQALSDL